MELPLAVVERVMRSAGADRLGENAVIAMRESAQEIAEEVAGDAVKMSGRGSVTAEDVEKALEA
ncbi:MAG: NFYB/HAP3 family transcription factor subunit [Candidatus Nanohaloarchaeota archaeon QJJ-7]|nr:NFYB/HAP3 family transcription factor subunit [Candidatus Nanohaloarchaeota archaeon QJJ-7]